MLPVKFAANAVFGVALPADVALKLEHIVRECRRAYAAAHPGKTLSLEQAISAAIAIYDQKPGSFVGYVRLNYDVELNDARSPVFLHRVGDREDCRDVPPSGLKPGTWLLGVGLLFFGKEEPRLPRRLKEVAHWHQWVIREI